ncbi:hypothetical protein SLS53_000247 [Cytospora paraplurivora]|uniref:Phosphoinositide phospholipase C n=1 Tax=Cytospora paraplurivora TaxID=2898453 RepID=A0AAN9ULG6_9PEZI
MPGVLSSAFGRLTPFNRRGSPAEDERGEETDLDTIAGGGHSARETSLTRKQLRVSHALRSFLQAEGVLPPKDLACDRDETLSAALQALVDRPHINVPPQVTDRSYPLPEYFISSSHNTYLTAHQLYGTSSASAYETTLRAGARCVEIDAWDDEANEEEPRVTHGYTLVSQITFRDVCETIRDVVDQEAAQYLYSGVQGHRPAPIMISLENHCGDYGQQRLVDIMKEVWGERLLSKAVREKGHREEEGGAHVTLEELGSKIVVIVENHLQGEQCDDSSTSDRSSDEEIKEARRSYMAKIRATKSRLIIPELAELGVYAQSVKPVDNSWFEQVWKTDLPHHHLINVSETGILGLLSESHPNIRTHNAHHLMRVYPKGTRISSQNLQPLPFWGLGAQICALNWQSFGLSLQLNEALFSGTDGYVLKPASLRSGGDGSVSTGQRKRLRLHIAGATNVPLPEGRSQDDIFPYVTASLMHPADPLDKDPTANKQKTRAYRQHKFGFFHHRENPPNIDPIWDETLEWEYDDSELAFVRILIKSDDSFAVNPVFALTTVRLMYAAEGWNFIRMLDLKGRETVCSLLVRFEIQDAD